MPATIESIVAQTERLLLWLTSWPDTLVGVVIGSMFTLTGVVLTNRTNLRNLRLQLQHDREQKSKERALAMRRDIYVAAAESLASALSTIARFGDLSLDNTALMSDYREKSAQLAKVHVVATEPTALALTSVMREVANVFINLNIQRGQLLSVRQQMGAFLDQMHRHNASRDQYLELMKQHNIRGTMDDRLMSVLQRGFDFEQDNSNKTAATHDALLAELRPKHMLFVEHCQRESARIAKLLLPVIASVRLELEQPIDVEAYAKVFAADSVFRREDLERLFGLRPSNDEPNPSLQPTVAGKPAPAAELKR